MHFSKTNNRVNLPGILSLSLLAIALFSCNKNTDEMVPVASKATNTGADISANRATSTIVPVNRIYYVSCANGGNGEEVEVSGNLNVVQNLIVNDNRYVYTYHINPQGLTGLGLTSGERFVASGGANGTQTGVLENGQFTTTFTEQLRIVGSTATFIVRYRFHVTINSEGVYTTTASQELVDCRAH